MEKDVRLLYVDTLVRSTPAQVERARVFVMKKRELN